MMVGTPIPHRMNHILLMPLSHQGRFPRITALIVAPRPLEETDTTLHLVAVGVADLPALQAEGTLFV